MYHITFLDTPDGRKMFKVYVKFMHANCVLARALRCFGFDAVALPHRVYITDRAWHDMDLRAHELTHCAQMQRDGFLFWPKALWYILRYGYHNSPYEVEARTVEKRRGP